MPEDHLSQSHHQSLRRWEPGGISWLLKDESAFKELPTRMRGIGQTAVREGIRLEKVTKLIEDGWLRDGPDWQQRRPNRQHQHTQSDPA